MAKGLPRSQGRNVPKQAVVKQTFPLRNLALSFTGSVGVGWATAVIGDLPDGNIAILGAVGYFQATKDAAASLITATFNPTFALGTAPTADNALAGTEVNILPATAAGAATAGVAPLVRIPGAVPAVATVLDNTDGSLELNLNATIDDASISGDTQVVAVTGYVVLSYMVLGDD